MSDLACARVLINGRVTGVGFRYFVTTKAEDFQVLGYVRNLDTGLVEVEVEGERQEIANFLGAIKSGPSHGIVSEFQTEWKQYKMLYDRFDVKY
jgi:acylphosphatase